MTYWLGLGSNLGDRLAMLRAALRRLASRGLVIEGTSGVYETEPRDLEDQPSFLNAVARVATPAGPPEVLATAKDVEAALGRTHGGPRFGPRPIDCDLLLWSGGGWHDERLEIPHPRLAVRRFALLPLLELDPDVRWPDGAPVVDSLSAIAPADQPARRVHEPLG